MTAEPVDALIVGAGPAGLMAAEMLAAPGRRIVLADAMPSPARKFLMAGKSGLNLTKAEPEADFARHFAGSVDLRTGDFGPLDVIEWAEGLGVELFTGSTGRVFPVGMKASPLLRAWLERLAGVDLRRRWRWTAIRDGEFGFDTLDGPQWIAPRVTVLALGGASWPRLGSDAAWVPMLRDAGVDVAGFRPANMGFRVGWSDPMRRHLGAAVKGVAIHAGGLIGRGEWVIGAQGVEGGGIYEVSAPMRDGANAHVDLAPDLDREALARRLAKPRGKLSVGNWLRRTINDPVKVALLLEWGQPLPKDPGALAGLIKALPLRHDGPMGLDGAISAAGGITGGALTGDLELRALPRTFAAGEMLDWEAPTGGYLLTGCLATGRRAGIAAARLLDQSDRALT
ncbi:NAD(P)/FAD-dependent oxidoreductase [Paracoccus zeaxanthinifaciens]|uniref:NAD(P)/FAD-dependent oxidoreductase n=1 Tax=Paracoccus zeaxanthinifaciens TaxID=187400 RepID=UPI0003B3C9C8|nr:TIGR03862 family flavoprotein [Paracoccus zeaxanthinifaciens]